MVTEIVKMELKEGISEAHFIGIVDEMEQVFHQECNGYRDSELFKDSDDIWYMIMHWNTKEDLKLASQSMMTSEKTLSFRECINPHKIRIKVYNQILAWNSEE